MIFPPEWCEGLERPPPEPLSSCPSSECVEWSVGEWGVCPCGGLGFRNRKVSCVRGDSEVDPEVCSQCFGPVSSVQVCNGVTPCTGEWSTGSTVVNYVNSIVCHRLLHGTF